MIHIKPIIGYYQAGILSNKIQGLGITGAEIDNGSNRLERSQDLDADFLILRKFKLYMNQLCSSLQ